MGKVKGSQMSLDIIENTREEFRKRELRLLGTMIFTATLFAMGVTIAGFWELPQGFSTWESSAVYFLAAFVFQGTCYFTYEVTMQTKQLDKQLEAWKEHHTQKLDELRELIQEWKNDELRILRGKSLDEDILPIELR